MHSVGPQNPPAPDNRTFSVSGTAAASCPIGLRFLPAPEEIHHDPCIAAPHADCRPLAPREELLSGRTTEVQSRPHLVCRLLLEKNTVFGLQKETPHITHPSI